MNSPPLPRHQADALTVLQALAAHFGWQGESLVVDGALVFQAPLPRDPDVSGAFFVVDAHEPNIRLYLTLPLKAPPAQIAAASEYVIRCGYARPFGALELDLDQGMLRVRMDVDAAGDALEPSVARLLDRATALAREVSPGWRAVVQEGVQGSDAASQFHRKRESL
jgi:hypothetical protein